MFSWCHLPHCLRLGLLPVPSSGSTFSPLDHWNPLPASLFLPTAQTWGSSALVLQSLLTQHHAALWLWRTILPFHFDINASIYLLSGLIIPWFPVRIIYFWKTVPQSTFWIFLVLCPSLFTSSLRLECLSFNNLENVTSSMKLLPDLAIWNLSEVPEFS